MQIYKKKKTNEHISYAVITKLFTLLENVLDFAVFI